jgi:Leucine-rich repeat (LRR) protein
MKHHPCLWATLVLAVCVSRAGAEDEVVVKKFERLGAVVGRDETKPNKPVIALRFGLRNPIPDTTPEFWKDYILDSIGYYARYRKDLERVLPAAPEGSTGAGNKAKDVPREDGAKPLDPVTLRIVKVTDADLKDVSKLGYLQTLDLSFGEITNKALEHIRALKNLHTLDLRNTQVDDAGLAMLKDLKNLKSLYLTNCPVTDDGLVHLRGLHLEALNLGGLCAMDRITDKGMRHLKQQRSLQKLHLEYVHKLTDDGLGELKELTNLRELSLRHAGVSDKGLKHLSGLKCLEELEVGANGKSPITDEGLKHLSGLQRLKLLDISNSQVSDEGLKRLSGLKQLATLDLCANGVTDEGMKSLQKLENLRKLSVAYTKVTDAGLKQLKRLKKLQRLDLRETGVTGAGQLEIKEALPKLEIGEIPQSPDWYKTYTEQLGQWEAEYRQRQFAGLARALSNAPGPRLPSYPDYKDPSGWGLRDSSGSGVPDWLSPVVICVLLGAAAAAGCRRRAK